MIIKKIELQGFKSFPERTKIVFHPGITAVVGPNGTGKSNIVDGILWVLGGQRHKGLRGEKTEDIIFNGNAKKPPLGMADVELMLEHDEEEIHINHRVFRSGESEYRLNGKAARLKDIQDALWKRAVAEKEYFVIEQGSIGLILTSKPTEKRQLLEEAAGTAFYKDKKKEAQSKLASSEQNLVRLEDIISEVSRAKNSLQRQAQAAVRYRKLREKIRELTGLNFKRKLGQLEHRHQEVSRQHSDGLLREKDLSLRIKNEERDLAEIRRILWELEKTAKETQEALLALESQGSRAEAEKERETRRGELLSDKGHKAYAAAAELEAELALLEADMAERQKAMADLEAGLEAKKDEAAKAEAGSQSIQESFALFEKSIEALKSDHLLKLAELTDRKNDYVKVEKELELVERQEAKLGLQLEQDGTLLQAKEESHRLIEGDLAAYLGAGKEREKSIGELARSLEERRAAMEKLKDWLDEAKKVRDEDYFRLQALQKMAQNQRESIGIVDIPEALGRLVDLIEAEPEYAKLIDVLWKEEAESTVIPALDFLRRAAERELEGRFLLVSSPREESAPRPAVDDPAVLGLLKSHLRPSPKIKDSLERLGEAVIVRDVRAAVELWLRHPALNFITPQGDILLSSGLFKLGRKEEGVFALGQEIKLLEERLASRDAEIAPLLAELEKKNEELRSIEEKLRLENSLRESLQQKLHELEKAKIASQAEVEKIQGSASLVAKEIDFLRREKEALAAKKESLFQRISGLDEEEKTIKAKIGAEEETFLQQRGQNVREEKRFIELRAGVSLIQERVHHAGQRLRELVERKENIQQKILSLKEEAGLAEKEKAELQEVVLALEAKAKTLEEEKKSKQAELVQRESDLQRNHADEEEREKKVAELREELERKKEERVKWEVAKAEVDRDLVNLEETCWQELKKTLHEVKNEPVAVELSDAEIDEELARADEDLQRFKAVNLMAEEEYLSHKERHDFLVQQRNDLRESIDATQQAIIKIDEESKTQFLTALAEVNKSFQEVFTGLFKGGSAEVKLIDETNPMESGVEIIAQPPGKKVQNIALLSGGEKSLTSLAFLFALFQFKPTPFCILDEVDAALDDANLARFLELMKNIKKDTQFIIITHNYKTMEVADYIYGTTMAEPNITRVYSVKLEKQPELM